MNVAHARIWSTLAAWCLGGLAALASSALHAAPQNGWWWNPAESGRGFFLEVQGPRMFMSGYFYGEDGRPTWLVSNDAMPDATAYDGRLLAFRDGQSLLGGYRHPSSPVDGGAVSLRFTDETHGTLTWPGGSVPIQRQPFHHDTASTFQARTGWWWNPDESGRGFSIEMQGDHLFLGAYMYDASGNAVWYVADALMQTPTRFSAPLLQFTNGQTMGGAYHAPAPPAIVGTITIDFSAEDQATVTLSDDVPMAAKTSRSITIKPQYVKPVAEKAVQRWVGSLWQETNEIDDAGMLLMHGEIVSMTWELDLPALDGGYPAFYKVRRGSFMVADYKANLPPCHDTGATSVDVGDGDLVVRPDGTYQGKLVVPATIHVTRTCVFETGTIVTSFDEPLQFDFVFSGHLDGGAIDGSNQASNGAATLSETWSFGPVQ